MAAPSKPTRTPTEVRAMRAVLRAFLRTDERPAMFRDLWSPKDVEVETAIRLVERGGFAVGLDGLSVDGVVGLASWGLVEPFRARWVLRSDVMTDYLQELQRCAR